MDEVQPFVLSDPAALWECEKRERERKEHNAKEREMFLLGLSPFLNLHKLDMQDPYEPLPYEWCPSSDEDGEGSDDASRSDWQSEEEPGASVDNPFEIDQPEEEPGFSTKPPPGFPHGFSIDDPGLSSTVPFLGGANGRYHPDWMGNVQAGKQINTNIMHEAMWFRGDGIPEGAWVGSEPPVYCTETDWVTGEKEAEAGKMLWILCMGSATDERATKSSLRGFFHSPMKEPHILNEVVAFLCPDRRKYALTLRLAHHDNTRPEHRPFMPFMPVKAPRVGHRYLLRGPLPVQKVCFRTFCIHNVEHVYICLFFCAQFVYIFLLAFLFVYTIAFVVYILYANAVPYFYVYKTVHLFGTHNVLLYTLFYVLYTIFA